MYPCLLERSYIRIRPNRKNMSVSRIQLIPTTILIIIYLYLKWIPKNLPITRNPYYGKHDFSCGLRTNSY